MQCEIFSQSFGRYASVCIFTKLYILQNIFYPDGLLMQLMKNNTVCSLMTSYLL